MSDGCTWWPDGSWLACCQTHDLAYDGAGSRLAADVALARCVFDATGNALLAFVMLAGVVLFGRLFRWIGRRRQDKGARM